MSNTGSITALSPSAAEDSYELFEAPNITGSPERRLLLGILERAILDFVGNDPKEIADAEDWIFGHIQDEDNCLQEFSFPWVCQQLDLDTESIAKSIAAMPKRGANRIAPWYFSKENAAQKKDLKKPTTKTSKVIQVDFSKVH